MKQQWYLEIINGFQYVLTAIQDNEVLQIIEFIVSILTSIVLIVCRIWKWYRDAKKDGKITKEEIDELANITEEELKKKDEEK